MKLLFAALLLAGNLVNFLQLGQEVMLPLKDLLMETEFREYQRKTRYRDRIDIFRKVLDRRSDLLRRYLQRGELDRAFDLLEKIQALAHYINDEASRVTNEKDLHSTQVKKLEIRLRQQIESIKDLRTTVPFEYLETFETTIQDLEDLRKALLRQMLGDTVGAMESTGGNTSDGLISSLLPLASQAVRTSAGFQPVSLQARDGFTAEEYADLQLHQELDNRVDVFLEIAETRLKVIRRRMEGREWKEKEENPLEFHTYRDMVHAYRKAIDGIMINIDEKAINKTASEEVIQESLKKLNKKIQEFIPQLEPLKQLAIELQDEALYQEVVEAAEVSIVAQKGSLYGLGAPVQ